MDNPILPAQISSAAATYRELLEHLAQTTDQLETDLREWDDEKVQYLLTKRRSLCAQLGKSRARLHSLVEALRTSGKADADALGPVVDWLASRESLMLQKQKACEAALVSGLQSCKTELAVFSRRRGVSATYRKTTGTQNACFIDNRL